MKWFLWIFFCISFSAYAEETFLHIGSPEQAALTQAQSKGQVLFVSMRVISCLKEGEKASVKAIEHVSCGGKASVVYESKGTMREASDKLFTHRQPLQLSFTRPEIMFGKDGYTIDPVSESRRLETQTSVSLTLSKVIEKQLIASAIVTEDRVKMADVLVYFNGDEYVNPTPVPYRRMMTSRGLFKLGETQNLTGDMWVELPYGSKQETLAGERQRLFLELTIK